MNRLLALALALASLTLGSCDAKSTGRDRGLIYVSLPPQATLAERLAGDRFDVAVLLGPGSSHEAYEPRPSQMRELAEAEIFVRAEVPFENAAWNRIVGVNPDMRVVRGFEAAPPSTEDEHDDHDEHDGHDHGPVDPHMWLDPANMKRQAEALAAALKEIDPDHAAEYDERLEGIVADIDALDRELRELLEPVRGRVFWVYHPAWGYFARAYGLEQQAIEREGREVGSRTLAGLIERARREEVRVIFIEPTTNRRNVTVLADEVGARVEVLNPLAPDYLENLRRVATAIAEALK